MRAALRGKGGHPEPRRVGDRRQGALGAAGDGGDGVDGVVGDWVTPGDNEWCVQLSRPKPASIDFWPWAPGVAACNHAAGSLTSSCRTAGLGLGVQRVPFLKGKATNAQPSGTWCPTARPRPRANDPLPSAIGVPPAHWISPIGVRVSLVSEENGLLTRLEVDGFKNLIDFSVDFAPYTCIAGPNGVGKSNVFDAIRFLSLLADHTLTEAALLVRGSGIEVGDVGDLFWSGGPTRRDEFFIAAEMIVDPIVRDDFGRPAEASSTYLRYEIRIGYEAPSARASLSRLVLLSESLDYITEGDASSKLRFPLTAGDFRKHVVFNRRRTPSGYISARKGDDGQTEILIHQDGGSRGPAQTAPAGTAPRTIVATSNTSATPTILAARREMQRWRFLALEPSAMRDPDRFHTDPHVTASGGHIAATLNRLGNEAESRGEDRANVFASIAQRLRELVPVSDIDVDIDQVRRLLTVEAIESTGVRLQAASLSDGTLRFLTLAVLVADPEAVGVLCVEEPENGIHPAKMAEMVRLLRDLAVDPTKKPGLENPFRQVIIATHSPVFVQLQNHDDLLFATEAKVKGEDGRPVSTLRCRPLSETWRARSGDSPVGMATILAYLSAPPGAQLELPALAEMTR